MYMPSIFRENFVDDFFDGMFPVRGHFNRPVQNLMKTDVKDVGDGYELEMEMPGYSKDEIKVELKKGTLTVSAEKKRRTKTISTSAERDLLEEAREVFMLESMSHRKI